jgi:hypothetical protein
MFGTHTFDVELDCPWMTTDVYVTFTNDSGDEKLTELESVVIVRTGQDITSQVNPDYFFDLIGDFVDNADYHYSDHGD